MYQAGILPRPWDCLPAPRLGTLLLVPTWPWCLLIGQDHNTHATWAQKSRCLHGVPGRAYFGAGSGGADSQACRVVVGVGELSVLGLDPWVLPWL